MRRNDSIHNWPINHYRGAAIERAAEHCSDTCVALWDVTTHTGIPRPLRADLKAAIELLRKIRTQLQEVAE